MPLELPSGAKILVRPDHEALALAAVAEDLPHVTLRARHIVADAAAEEAVMEALARLPSTDQVKVSHTYRVSRHYRDYRDHRGSGVWQ